MKLVRRWADLEQHCLAFLQTLGHFSNVLLLAAWSERARQGGPACWLLTGSLDVGGGDRSHVCIPGQRESCLVWRLPLQRWAGGH